MQELETPLGGDRESFPETVWSSLLGIEGSPTPAREAALAGRVGSDRELSEEIHDLLPQSFTHEYWDGSSWKPLNALHDYEHANDLYSGGHFTIVRFAPVTTTKIRLSVQLKAGKSGDILEWRVPE